MTNNAVPPSVTPPSPFEWPQTVFSITGVTQDSQAIITCADHPFGSEDPFITQLTFKQIKGMIPLNGITALITEVLDDTRFVVNVNTTQFPVYQSGGVICVDTGQPPVEQQGSQFFNTPFQNIANN